MASSSSRSATSAPAPRPYMESDGIDRFSVLPEDTLMDILSRVPTKTAIGTSFLCHNFVDLWKSLKSIEVSDQDFRPAHKLIEAVNKLFEERLLTRAQRDQFVPLDRFKLQTAIRGTASGNAISRWLKDAEFLGVKDLHLDIGANTLERVFEVLVTVETLEKLFVNSNCYRYVHDRILPEIVTLPNLRSLHIKSNLRDEDLERLISLLPVLETLILEEIENNAIILFSRSLKKFKVTYLFNSPAWYVRLSLPNLEDFECTFRINNELDFMLDDMPLVQKAVININGIEKGFINKFVLLLGRLVNTRELAIDIRQRQFLYDDEASGPRRELVDQLPTFTNMESLNISMCFNKEYVQYLIHLLNNCPTLQSANFIHKAPLYSSMREGTSNQKICESGLPSYKDRDRAHFEDLHIGSKKDELIQLLVNERLFNRG